MEDISMKTVGVGDRVVFVLPDTKALALGKVTGFANGKAKIDGDDGFRYRASSDRLYIVRKAPAKKTKKKKKKVDER